MASDLEPEGIRVSCIVLEDYSKKKAPSTGYFKLTVNRDTTADLIKKSSTDDTIYKLFDEVNIKCDPTV